MYLSDDETLTFNDIRAALARGDIVYYLNSENRIFIHNGQLIINGRARYVLKQYHLAGVVIIPNTQNYYKPITY